jgi:CBS domain-containing protein
MKNPLIIDQFMTLSPHTINSGMQLKTARQLMKKYRVRHLPVQFSGQLVGIISDRDLNFAKSFDKEGLLMVDDVMTPDPYAVRPGTPLGEVVEKMATNLYGCAVIQGRDGKVKGIFTAIDGLRAISENLNIKKRKSKNGKEALV